MPFTPQQLAERGTSLLRALAAKFAELGKVASSARLPLEFDNAMIARLRADYVALGKEIDTVEHEASLAAESNTKTASSVMENAAKRLGAAMTRDSKNYTNAQLLAWLANNRPDGNFNGMTRKELLAQIVLSVDPPR